MSRKEERKEGCQGRKDVRERRMSRKDRYQGKKIGWKDIKEDKKEGYQGRKIRRKDIKK